MGLDQSRDFAAHLKNEKVSVETFEPGGLSHFGILSELEKAGSPTAKKISAFIE